jgi:hypothetical protein
VPVPRTAVRNDTEDMLCLWLEPWGSDHWMRPGERFTVVAGELIEPVDDPFEVNVHDQGISVWVNAANSADVMDADGNEVPCGHQCPLEAIRAWTESARQAVDQAAGRSAQVQEMTRKNYEHLRRILEAAEVRATATADTVVNLSRSPSTKDPTGNPG